VEKEGMKNRRAAALKEAGTRRMVSASLAKKVALFFSQKPISAPFCGFRKFSSQIGGYRTWRMGRRRRWVCPRITRWGTRRG
jgi:hypothetical protein